MDKKIYKKNCRHKMDNHKLIISFLSTGKIILKQLDNLMILMLKYGWMSISKKEDRF